MSQIVQEELYNMRDSIFIDNKSKNKKTLSEVNQLLSNIKPVEEESNKIVEEDIKSNREKQRQKIEEDRKWI